MTAVSEVGEPVAWLQAALGLAGKDTPFPWQATLLRKLMNGELPPALDIPTGLGKTAVMAIWLVARAFRPSLPRRLVYVVDRRAVVDQATTEAERIRDVVEKHPALGKALGLTGPLPISTLRGQYVDNREWLEDPSSTAILVGTVDMIGSRLLFEGYRCSRKMRPYHAALLGADALIVLDEAHLVPAFEAVVRSATTDETLRAPPSTELRRAIPRSQLMSLSATGRGAESAFGLDKPDLEHSIVKRRLDAQKHVRLGEPVERESLPEAMARKAWELTDGGNRPSRVIVFVDSRKVAQAVCEALNRRAKADEGGAKIAIETELFVGGRRIAERERAARRLAALGVIAGSPRTCERPVFIVATSAGEVGVDLDADHAVLDLVEWERMVQRLGRVNRRGDGEANVWIVPVTLDSETKKAVAKSQQLEAQRRPDADDGDDAEENDKPPKKLKEDERARVERWRRRQATERAVRSLPSSPDGFHDASPRAVTELKKQRPALVEEGSTPAPLRPELTRAVLESWSMTSLEEHPGRPKVAPWLRGWVDEEPQTAVVWRKWLPRNADAGAFFDAAPIETVETLEQETKYVFEWLFKRVKQAAKSNDDDGDGSTGEVDQDRGRSLQRDDVVVFVVDDRPRGWTLGELDDVEKRGKDDFFRAIVGGTIVVDARLGGLDDNGLLDSTWDEPTEEVEPELLSFRVRHAVDVDALSPSDGWRLEDTFISRTNDDGEAIEWLVVETDPRRQSTTEDGRSTGREQRLDEHQSCAEKHAKRIGERVGLQAQHVNLLMLAAVLHDEGKKAERWQRAFRAPKDKRPLGKTTSRPIQAILAGYRHELGSLPFAERDSRVAALSQDDRALVLHLIAAHHGFARPILRTDGSDDAPPSALVERARTIALRYAHLEKRWGPWGLAWWEALLRAADQSASRENDEREGGEGG